MRPVLPGSAVFRFAEVIDFGQQVGAVLLSQKIADEFFVPGLIVLQECRLKAFFFSGPGDVDGSPA